MNQQPAVEFRDVSLRYRIMADRGITSLKEMAIRLMVSRIRYKELVALSNVTFSISSGHALGVIGHNGAGKSTLLRVAAGILRPTVGTAIIRGRQAPVIELGLGFEAELSGPLDNLGGLRAGIEKEFLGAFLRDSLQDLQGSLGRQVDGHAVEVDGDIRHRSVGRVAFYLIRVGIDRIDVETPLRVGAQRLVAEFRPVFGSADDGYVHGW